MPPLELDVNYTEVKSDAHTYHGQISLRTISAQSLTPRLLLMIVGWEPAACVAQTTHSTIHTMYMTTNT